MVEEAEVLVERRGAVGHIVLNRPQALNALTHGMVVTISETLQAWSGDPTISVVVLSGAGERAFCAGGDLVTLYRGATGGDEGVAERFWRDEFALDLQIAQYPKPVIAVMHGVTLGGGVGLAGHASHRVVSERSTVGMPETTIGYVPDVGGTWLLSRGHGEIGTYLALSATSAGPGDAIALGLADHFVPEERLPELLERGDLSALAGLESAPPAPELLPQRGWIDEAFAGDDAAAILSRLEGREIEAVIAAKSPTAVAVTLEALRRARKQPDLAAALAQEFRVSMHSLASPDFAEGIRAQVIDKDRTPRWNPARIDDVARETVDSFFAPLERELWQ